MSEETKGSSSQLKSPISYKGLGIIAVLAIAYQFYIMYIASQQIDEFELSSASYAIGSIICSITAFIVAKRYSGSEVFGKAYFALGLAFLMLFAGDLTYNYYEYILEEDPYPSLADVFYLAFPVFAMYHLVKNIKYFKRDVGTITKIWVGTITAVITLAYAYFSLSDIGEANFDFYFGLLFVATSATIFSHAVLGATVFRHSILGTAWLLLATGIFIYTIADVWYYYLELFGQYDEVHPTNTLWILSFMVVVYALYKHQKVI